MPILSSADALIDSDPDFACDGVQVKPEASHGAVVKGEVVGSVLARWEKRVCEPVKTAGISRQIVCCELNGVRSRAADDVYCNTNLEGILKRVQIENVLAAWIN
jgi:hypothetical protein